MNAHHDDAPIYRGEYAYRQGFGFERELPDYLRELVEAAEAGLRADPNFTAECSIDLGRHRPKYRLVMNRQGMTLTTRIRDDEEDTVRPASRFQELGGIRDILAGIVEGGGLPNQVNPNLIHIRYL